MSLKIHTVFLPLFVALLVSGCSGSSEPSTINEADIANVGDTNVSMSDGGVQNETTTTALLENTGTETETTNNVPSESTNTELETTNTVPSESTITESETTNNAPTAPMNAATRVNFDITVPVYVSDALQVRLVWGDIDTTAIWVTDESWSVDLDLPTSTANQLSVRFNDDNGATTLGSFETEFRTGTSEAESFVISAAQFDTDRWDSDNDGVSNLLESIAGTIPSGDDAPESVQASLELVTDKTFRLSWQLSATADFYRVLENADGLSGFEQISEDLNASEQVYDHRVALYNRVNARYIVQACNTQGCTDSDVVIVTGTLNDAVGRFVSSNDEVIGSSVSISNDGETLAVSGGRGGSHIFNRIDDKWELISVVGSGSVRLSGDGQTLAVSRPFDSCTQFTDATQIAPVAIETGCQFAPDSGAVYLYALINEAWQLQAALRSPLGFSSFRHNFGHSISLSDDGNTLAVGAPRTNNSQGSVYLYTRAGEVWSDETELQASNGEPQFGNDELPGFRSGDAFGVSVSLSGDGGTLAVGAGGEDSAATGVNGDQFDNTSPSAGAAYIFVRSDESWQQQAYLKAGYQYPHPMLFGLSVALSKTGDILAVGVTGDDSIASGINGDPAFASEGISSGAVYIFARTGSSWQQQAYIKASNPDRLDEFGIRLSLSSDGNTLAVVAQREKSAATGINGDQADNSKEFSGAVYVFKMTAGQWQQRAYVKSPENIEPGPGSDHIFGTSVSLSGSGDSLVVGGSFFSARSAFLF